MLINCKQLADAIQLFYDATNVLKGTKMPGEQVEIWTGLLARIYFLGAAIYQLGRGTEIPEIASHPHFWDPTSMTVLARSLLETSAQINYLFLEQITDDEREYRLCCFMLHGLLLRQGTKAVTQEEQTKQQNEQATITNLKTRISKTKRFTAFSPKLQQRLLDGHHSKEFEPSKTQLIKSYWAGVPVNVESIYAFLSDYAHAGYVSAFQIYDHTTQKEAGNNTLLSTAKLIETITVKIALSFPPVREYLVRVGYITHALFNR